jgi:hypothetical protein
VEVAAPLVPLLLLPEEHAVITAANIVIAIVVT